MTRGYIGTVPGCVSPPLPRPSYTHTAQVKNKKRKSNIMGMTKEEFTERLTEDQRKRKARDHWDKVHEAKAKTREHDFYMLFNRIDTPYRPKLRSY